MNALPLTEARGQRTRPLRLKAKVTVGNSIHVNSASRSTTLWLSPELVDFEKRVKGDRQRTARQEPVPGTEHLGHGRRLPSPGRP
ncbi:MAG: hypothetical protein CM1200mP2_18690 [Planctomycetaceae bacterium]|nr:MAG: hypothetical protein CM1200mP2_18690 [Planctomycetaceae bacterium]